MTSTYCGRNEDAIALKKIECLDNCYDGALQVEVEMTIGVGAGWLEGAHKLAGMTDLWNWVLVGAIMPFPVDDHANI